MEFISVVIPVFNDKRIKYCLNALLQLDYPKEKHEVIIVDNNCDDGTEHLIRKYPFNVVKEKKKGPYAARNKGIEISKGKIIAFIDSDCVVETDWLRVIDKNIWYSDALIGYTKGINKNWCAEGKGYQIEKVNKALEDADIKGSLHRLDTRNCAVWKTALMEVGCFSNLLMNYGDYEIGCRLFDAGKKIKFVKDMIVSHINITNITKAIKSSIRDRYLGCRMLNLHNKEFKLKYMRSQYMYFVKKEPPNNRFRLYYLIVRHLLALFVFRLTLNKKKFLINFDQLMVYSLELGVLKAKEEGIIRIEN